MGAINFQNHFSSNWGWRREGVWMRNWIMNYDCASFKGIANLFFCSLHLPFLVIFDHHRAASCHLFYTNIRILNQMYRRASNPSDWDVLILFFGGLTIITIILMTRSFEAPRDFFSLSRIVRPMLYNSFFFYRHRRMRRWTVWTRRNLFRSRRGISMRVPPTMDRWSVPIR